MKCYKCNNYNLKFYKKRVLPKWLFLEIIIEFITIISLAIGINAEKPYNGLFYGISIIFAILIAVVIIINRTEHKGTKVKCKICKNKFWLKEY